MATFTTYSRNAPYILDRRIILDRKREEIGSIAHGDSRRVKVHPSSIPSIGENRGRRVCKIACIKKEGREKERERERRYKREERKKRIQSGQSACARVPPSARGTHVFRFLLILLALTDNASTRRSRHACSFTRLHERAAGQRG